MAEEVPAGEVTQETQERGYEGNNASGGGVLGQHQEHKPGMTEKLKLTFSSVKERVAAGGGNSPRQVTVDGGRVGDAVAPTYSGGSPRPILPGEPASPKVPRRDLGERIIDKLPGSHTSPYSVGHPPSVPNPYVSGDDSAVPTNPSDQRSAEQSSGFFGKLKNMVTGQKPTQGTGTENATTGTAGTTGATGKMPEGYAQSPTPQESGDLYDRTKAAMGGRKGPDVGSEEAWPTPAKPDHHNKPGATYTDEEGRPIEGPTLPKSEDTKKEGLMSKLMDKLHLNEKSTSPKAATTDGVPPQSTTS